MKTTFPGLARRVAREFFPEHVEVSTSFDGSDWVREDSADIVEIRVADRSGDVTQYGIANISGQVMRSGHLEDVMRYELRHLAKEMGFVPPPSGTNGEGP